MSSSFSEIHRTLKSPFLSTLYWMWRFQVQLIFQISFMLDWGHQNENNFNSYCSSKVSDPMTTLTTLTFSHCQLPRIQHSFSLKRKVQDNSINIYWTLTTCKRLPKYCKDGDTNSWAGNRTVSSLLLEFTGRYHYQEMTLKQILTLCSLTQKLEWFCGLSISCMSKSMSINEDKANTWHLEE